MAFFDARRGFFCRVRRVYNLDTGLLDLGVIVLIWSPAPTLLLLVTQEVEKED